MKLKKIVFALALVLCATGFGFAADDVKAAITPTTPTETPASARSQQLVNRLEEIKAMDIESMSKAEKRKLRKEVRSIEKEMKEINEGGVYISVGGIIIILLLLILLL